MNSSLAGLSRASYLALTFTLFVLVFGDATRTVEAQSFTPAADYVAGPSPNAVAVGDFNGDSNPDLVVGDQKDSSNKVGVLLGSVDIAT